MEKRERVVRRPSNIRASGSEGNHGLHNGPKSNQLRKSSVDFNAHIISMFPPAGGKSSDIDLFVNDWLPECTAREISDFVRIAGKKSRVKSYLHLKRHLPTIASRIEDLSLVSWKPINVSAVLYGLQCFQEDDDGYLAVVAAMRTALMKSIERKCLIPPQSISMAILGLQKNKLKARQSIELLNSIKIMIISCKDSL